MKAALYIFIIILLSADLILGQASSSSNRSEAIACYNKANLELREKDFDRAITLFTQSINLDPEFAKAYLFRGYTYFLSDQFDLAIIDLNQAIIHDSQLDKAYYFRGLCWIEKEDYNSALHDLSACIRINNTWALPYFKRGRINYISEHYILAINDFSKAIQFDPNLQAAYHLRANSFLQENDFYNAISDFDFLIQKNPNNAQHYYHRGFAYLQIDDELMASRDFEMAIKLVPDNATLANNLVSSFFDMGDFQAAYSFLLANKRSDIAYYFQMGYSCIMLHEYDSAIKYFSKVIRKDKIHADAFYYRGMAYAKLNNKEKACSDFKSASKLGNSAARENVNEFCGS